MHFSTFIKNSVSGSRSWWPKSSALAHSQQDRPPASRLCTGQQHVPEVHQRLVWRLPGGEQWMSCRSRLQREGGGRRVDSGRLSRSDIRYSCCWSENWYLEFVYELHMNRLLVCMKRMSQLKWNPCTFLVHICDHCLKGHFTPKWKVFHHLLTLNFKTYLSLILPLNTQDINLLANWIQV